MSLELLKESIKVNRVIGEEAAQTIIENDIIVPDAKPDIERILLLDGEAYVSEAEVIQDRILVGGMIRYKILYISDDPEQPLKSINTNANFSYGLDVADSKQGMKCRVKCDIEHIDYEILNGRKVNVKTILGVNGKVMEELEQPIVNDLTGIENAQVMRDSFTLNNYIGSNEDVSKIKETLEIPAGKPTIKEILRNDVKITGKDYKITDNKIIAKGELNISTLYLADDETRSVQFMEHEIPFAQSMDLPGIREDMNCNVDFAIADCLFDAEEDSDGELRFLKGEVTLNLWAEGFYKSNIEVIADAYSPNARLSIEKEPFKVEDSIAGSKSQVTLKDNVFIDNENPEISEVFNVLCKPSLSEYKVEDDKVVIEGVVSNKILYLANNSEQPVFCNEQEMPLKHSIELKGAKPGMSCEIELDAEHCSYSMNSSKEIEIRVVISISVRASRQVTIPLVSKITESPLDDSRLAAQPSIIIYFSQPGDTLWNIAKKYYTTMDEIKKINNLSDINSVSPGQQIIIPRRKA